MVRLYDRRGETLRHLHTWPTEEAHSSALHDLHSEVPVPVTDNLVKWVSCLLYIDCRVSPNHNLYVYLYVITGAQVLTNRIL